MAYKPRLTILAAHFSPETNAASRRLTAAAKHFHAAGWEVTVITQAPHHPQNMIYDEYNHFWRQDRNEDGIRVIRFKPWVVPNTNVFLRFATEIVFTTKALLQGLVIKTDVVLASSPYMFLGPGALFVSKLTRSAFAWDIRDFTWKYVGAAGRRVYGMDRILEKIMYKTAELANLVTTATEGQRSELMESTVTLKGKVRVMPNGLTGNLMSQLQQGQDIRLDHRITILYAGLLGFPQGLESLLEAAEELPEFRFILAGDGPAFETLREQIALQALSNVELWGHVPLKELRDLYASADILVAMLRNDPAFKVAQPSKVWEYMAVGKPVLFAGDCETTNLMEMHNLGVVVPYGDVQALVSALRDLAENPTNRLALAARARAFVMNARNRDVILNQWEHFLRRCI